MLTDSKPLSFVLGVDEELAVDGGEEVDPESRSGAWPGRGPAGTDRRRRRAAIWFRRVA